MKRILKLDPKGKLQRSLQDSCGERANGATTRAIHARIGISQIDLVERVKSVSSETQSNTLRDRDRLSQTDVGLEEARPGEGIAANISDLACTRALPGSCHWSRNRLAVAI